MFGHEPFLETVNGTGGQGFGFADSTTPVTGDSDFAADILTFPVSGQVEGFKGSRISTNQPLLSLSTKSKTLKRNYSPLGLAFQTFRIIDKACFVEIGVPSNGGASVDFPKTTCMTLSTL